MKPINHIIIIATAMICSVAMNAKSPAAPRAELQVSYKYHEKFLRGNTQFTERDIPMLLLVNSTQSKFFSPATEYKDSLQSTPSGRAKEKEIFDIAIRKYAESKDESTLDAVTYKIFMYIFKDYGKESVTVYDKAGMSDRGVYSEPFSELAWAIGDSTKIVLGYECFMATADYPGRRWTAWFAPEIPVQDGPWKLRGLPGLILEAYEPKGHHHFTADGIEQTDRPIYPIYDKDKYDRMKRTDMLKSLRNDRDNSNSMIKASIGLDLGDDAPAQTEYDYLETDYR